MNATLWIRDHVLYRMIQKIRWDIEIMEIADRIRPNK